MKRTPINSIRIPPRFLKLCRDWSGGINCMLYAIASTGGLTLGSRRPAGRTNEEWYLYIWKDLSSDVSHALGHSEGADKRKLSRFKVWVDQKCERLANEYELDN